MAGMSFAFTTQGCGQGIIEKECHDTEIISSSFSTVNLTDRLVREAKQETK